MLRVILAIGLVIMVGMLVLPTLLVTGFSSDSQNFDSAKNQEFQRNREEMGKQIIEVDQPFAELTKTAQVNILERVETISVFRSSTELIEDVPLEEYIVGVVASEMPASYEVEALKAQALTARTYVIRQLLNGNDIHLPDGADVTDTVMHQVYKNETELEDQWGNNFDWRMSRIRQAVYETEGEIITYNNEPITATFFSTSNGYTENSEEYWANEIPYLRSVESPWDMDSPRYKNEVVISASQFGDVFNVAIGSGEVGEIISRTTGGRVAKAVIGGKALSGREIRDVLELDSSDFTWQRRGDDVVIETRGWGHGVGMSQFGADGMARDGNDYEAIIHHYYQGVTIEHVRNVLVNADLAKTKALAGDS